MFARLCCLWLVCVGLPLAAAEQPVGYSDPLFDGHSLYGWHVTNCEAVVEDGAIRIKSGNGLLRTDHRYSDFVLELEWKALNADKYDSGIYFRAELPPEGKPWPAKYQANLAKGSEGVVKQYPDITASKGLVKPGTWNHFKFTAVGPRVSLEINGQQAWQIDDLDARSGYIGLQAEVPSGGEFLFRNIKITELGFRSLFNGRDLEGWEGAGQPAERCWQVEDGVLMCTGQKGPWLRSAQQFDDFNLRLEYRVSPGGNSGVYLRVAADGNHHGDGSGVEVQILDDAHPRYAKLQPRQYSASLYDFIGAQPRVSRPAGQWNSLELDVRGTQYRIFHNGVEVVRADESQFPGLSKRRLEGFLGLQNHSTQVWFRSLRIGPPQP